MPINVLIEQIEHFGTKSLFTDLKFRHRENVSRIDTFDIYLIGIINNKDYESFNEGYNQLLANGLKHEHVLEHVKSTRLYFFHKSENLEKVIAIYLKSNNSKIDEIILILLKDKEMRNAYKTFRLSNKNPKLRNIDIIFNKLR